MGKIPGLITAREVILNAPLIVREFGWPVLWRCAKVLASGKAVPFLTILLVGQL